MKPLKLTLSLTLLLLIVSGIVSETKADISNAALLYLRIAPGARAAGMGEAYVAVADDATSTHWNPAGLGISPLANSWEESTIPEHLKPISLVTAFKARSGNDYLAYDIWAITGQGLVRNDNKKWHEYEIFDTKTDQTVKSIAASYFNLQEGEQLDMVVEKIAISNSIRSYKWLKEFSEKVLSNIPDDYDRTDELTTGFDSLLLSYNLCLINWEKLTQAEKHYNEAMKDSVFSISEIEKVNFAIEKSRNRFIPEELRIPYSTIFDGEPTVLASSSELLIAGNSNGIFSYNGEGWRQLSEAEGLPSNNVTSAVGLPGLLLIGTDVGVFKYNGVNVSPLGSEDNLPQGEVSALGASSSVDVWAVVDNQLYHFDGSEWTNYRRYTTVIDDTPEKIAEKFALYNTGSEKKEYVRLLKELNKPTEKPMVEEEAVAGADAVETDAATEVADSSIVASDSNESGKSVEVEKSEHGFIEVDITSDDFAFEAGTRLKIPYLSHFIGQVNDIHVSYNGELWFATEYGVVNYDGHNWKLPGYTDYTVNDGDVLDSVLTINNQNVHDKATYRKIVKDINDLESEQLSSGQVIKIYLNPVASSIRNITSRNGKIYFASSNGLFEYSNNVWRRSDVSDLNNADVIKVRAFDNKLWLASSDKIVTKADGRTDISMMVAKWLPQLADDMYYGFLSVVTNIDGFGTVGGNVTFISYGTIQRTSDQQVDLGTFEPFDVALTLSYGGRLTSKLKFGLSAKVIYSHLSNIGAGVEVGEGVSTGFALDIGLLYQMNKRLNLGMAITNLGPDISYIDAAQSDPLPRNLALGFAYKLFNSEYYHLLITAEVNKLLVGVNDGFSEELKQLIFNVGGEFMYANLFAFRAGYIYDEEGDVKTVTLGFGLQPLENFKFDFAYIPSGTEAPLANTLRISLQILP